MNINKPHERLLSDSVAAVLLALTSMPAGSSGRAIARGCPGISVAQVNNVLRQLEKQGVVRTEPVPPAIRYFLNPEHVLTQPLLALVGAGKSVLSRLRELFLGFPGLHSAIVFGSIARGAGDQDSDLDLLLIFEDTDEELDHASLMDLSFQFWKLTGTELNYIALSLSEVTPNLIASSGFLQNVMNEGQVIIGRNLGKANERSQDESPSTPVHSDSGRFP